MKWDIVFSLALLAVLLTSATAQAACLTCEDYRDPPDFADAAVYAHCLIDGMRSNQYQSMWWDCVASCGNRLPDNCGGFLDCGNNCFPNQRCAVNPGCTDPYNPNSQASCIVCATCKTCAKLGNPVANAKGYPWGYNCGTWSDNCGGSTGSCGTCTPLAQCDADCKNKADPITGELYEYGQCTVLGECVCVKGSKTLSLYGGNLDRSRSCGTCGAIAEGNCGCSDAAFGKECGYDGCNMEHTCPDGDPCDPNGLCLCTDKCPAAGQRTCEGTKIMECGNLAINGFDDDHCLDLKIVADCAPLGPDYGCKNAECADVKPPTTAIKCDGEECMNCIYKRDVSVSFSCKDLGSGCDPAKTYYCYDKSNSCYPKIPSSTQLKIAEGTYYVRYSSMDNAGNVEPTKTERIEVVYGKEAPLKSAIRVVRLSTEENPIALSYTTNPQTNLIQVTFDQTVINPPPYTTMTIDVDPNLPDGVYSIIIKGTSEGLERTVTYKLTSNMKGSLTCIREAPDILIEPSSRSAFAGTEIAYDVEVKNNDNDACGESSFSLNSYCPTGWSCPMDRNSLLLQPGAAGSTVIRVTSATGATPETYDFGVTANNAARHAEYVVLPAPCNRNGPSVYLSGISFAGSSMKAALNVENKDTGACGSTSFILGLISCPSGWACSLSKNSVMIGAGFTDSSTEISISPSGTAAPGTYRILFKATNSVDSSIFGESHYNYVL